MSAIPSAAQLRWQRAPLGIFHHLGINTFFNKEWSDGTLPASGFNPTDLDCADWASAAKAAGANYAILTAKHHDGFCLWPTATTAYSVASSPWREGRGDVVREFVDACRAHGIAPGLYLSPWDRNAACYPDPAAYDDFYCRQLEELCTRYGDLFELWFDGAGSEGRVYDWPRIMAVAKRHQPRAMVFNMGAPTIRWVGNEDGLASDPVVYAVRDTLASAFGKDAGASFDAAHWLPPECDVPIRRNWFWQDDDLVSLKSVDELLAIWYRSIGLGANLLLNVPPDRRGRLDPDDRARLLSWAQEVRARFARPLEATLARDGASTLIDFGGEVEFDHLWLEEDLLGGQRIDGFSLRDGVSGVEFASGRTIGAQRVAVFPRRRARSVRLVCSDPAALLTRACAFRTGHERLPDPADKFEYKEWANKVDQPIRTGSAH
ncbi:MAG: alpha-L-fucosidase [Planctomycetes bacterium]|nr:alpha-L-fucosidase [Planctomycetota bacterium]